MAWSFGAQVQGRLSPSGRPMKRPASRECLAPHAKHHVSTTRQAAVPPGGNAEVAAAAPPSQAADGIDVAAVAAKHGCAGCSRWPSCLVETPSRLQTDAQACLHNC